MEPIRNLPLGFGMALAQNQEAMNSFCEAPPEKQAEILQQARSVHSKAEMKLLVARLTQ